MGKGERKNIGEKGKGNNRERKRKGTLIVSRTLIVSGTLCAMYAFHVHIIRTVIGTVID